MFYASRKVFCLDGGHERLLISLCLWMLYLTVKIQLMNDLDYNVGMKKIFKLKTFDLSWGKFSNTSPKYILNCNDIKFLKIWFVLHTQNRRNFNKMVYELPLSS